ncbi:MAG: sugar ABC transporter ATP-binding protein [Limisphaerales bacterium]
MRGIHKAFPGVQALRDVTLELHEGEVLALMGENGAGKSTLIKILGGAHRPDQGRISLHGAELRIGRPQDAYRAGISIIYQEFNLIPELSIRENIFLGRERTHRGWIRAAEERQETFQLLSRIGLNLDPETRCRTLTVAQQQKVEIAKALSVQARILVMDEPSAALTTQEVENLFKLIRDLKDQGLGIIYISHRLDEIFAVADRVMILRDGTSVGNRLVSDVSREQLIELMVGRSLDSEFPKHAATIGQERLRVEHLSRADAVNDVRFHVRAGEILGFAGLAGAGRTETMRLIFGADRRDGGRIMVNGRAVEIRDPRDAIRHGICLLTEDRKAQGLILKHSVRENFGLPNLDLFSRGPLLDLTREKTELESYVQNLKIKLTSTERQVGNLSGGNQQKVVLAKWLARNADIVIFDEPTRGIDVGAKYEIYLLMNRLAAEGKAVIMISSELPEVLGMSDRILVMHEGRIRGEITDVTHATQEDILSMAIA